MSEYAEFQSAADHKKEPITAPQDLRPPMDDNPFLDSNDEESVIPEIKAPPPTPPLFLAAGRIGIAASEYPRSKKPSHQPFIEPQYQQPDS